MVALLSKASLVHLVVVAQWLRMEEQEMKVAAIEGLDWRPKRGEWMGADTNSSQELGLYPNSTSKEPAHTCQDHVVTTDLLTLGTS
jgi:hypothetical protein